MDITRWSTPKSDWLYSFAAKDGEALYSQQKQDQELTVAQITSSLLPNSDLNWKKVGKTTALTRQTFVGKIMSVLFNMLSRLVMILAIVSSRSCFCWLYRASPSLAAKEYNQSDFSVDHLVMSMCRVISCVVGEGVCYAHTILSRVPCAIQ